MHLSLRRLCFERLAGSRPLGPDLADSAAEARVRDLAKQVKALEDLRDPGMQVRCAGY